jgi:hypothetical protein
MVKKLFIRNVLKIAKQKNNYKNSNASLKNIFLLLTGQIRQKTNDF